MDNRFVVLPFGVRNAVEAGETVAEGDDPGAPINPMLARKALITTALATVIFAGVYVFVARYWWRQLLSPLSLL